MIRWIFFFLTLGSAMSMATTYRRVSVDDVVLGRVQPGHVMVTGRYLADGAYQELVRGVITGIRYALYVEGQVFDYKPEPGTLLEVWGMLEKEPDGWKLYFHNAREPGEDRLPRPVGDPQPGAVLRVWLRVYSAGGAAGRLIGRSEDGRSFYLTRAPGGPGLRCLVGRLQDGGVIEFLGPCGTETDN